MGDSDIVSTVCKICLNPTFMCNCDNSWQLFDNILNNNCKGDIINEVKYSDISISTMTVCFNFNQFINSYISHSSA